MQKLLLEQKIKQKLSSRQIQSIALLQLSQVQMKDRIIKELEDNPTLVQEGSNSEENLEKELSKLYGKTLENQQATTSHKTHYYNEVNQEWQNKSISSKGSWQEELLHQLRCLSLNQNDYLIAEHIIGSLDKDGYLRRTLEAIADDMAFIHYIHTNPLKIAKVLNKIQSLEPPGIGARNIQECLLIQLKKKEKDPSSQLAIHILTNHFELFTKRKYEKIKTQITNHNLSLFKDALKLITRLNPKPISIEEEEKEIVYPPDFIVQNWQGNLQVMLYKDELPKLKISKNYTDFILGKHEAKDTEHKKTLRFLKEKILRAQWFIEALKQRKKTLLNSMKAIVELQKDFFKYGEESLLKPIILNDVAQKINMDISTVSRAISQRRVETQWGIYSLKYFFSEPINTTSGKKASNRIVKSTLSELIKNEDKLNPYSDIKLAIELKKKGYLVARRTVTKYREQLKLPTSRLRKSI